MSLPRALLLMLPTVAAYFPVVRVSSWARTGSGVGLHPRPAGAWMLKSLQEPLPAGLEGMKGRNFPVSAAPGDHESCTCSFVDPLTFP